MWYKHDLRLSITWDIIVMKITDISNCLGLDFNLILNACYTIIDFNKKLSKNSTCQSMFIKHTLTKYFKAVGGPQWVYNSKYLLIWCPGVTQIQTLNKSSERQFLKVGWIKYFFGKLCQVRVFIFILQVNCDVIKMQVIGE